MVDFVSTLIEMRNGKVAEDISREFQEVYAAVLETGGKGKLTLTFDIRPSKADIVRGEVKEVELEHSVSIKKPKRRIGASVFYVKPDGGLSRTDPEQLAMFENEGVRTNG